MMNAQMDNIAVKMIMDAINALVRNINIIMIRNILWYWFILDPCPRDPVLPVGCENGIKVEDVPVGCV